MSTFSPLPAYIIGGASLLLSLNSFFAPRNEYPRFGLLLESTSTSPAATQNPKQKKTAVQPNNGFVSPLIYLKGIRELTYGLGLIALQYTGNDAGVTILAAVISLAGLGDGFVVRSFGGETLKHKAFGHWFAFVGLAGWAWWRTAQQ